MIKYRASKLTMKDVSIAEEREFLNSNHYQGYIASSWCKGLYDGDKLIELMSFGPARFTTHQDYELLRLCTLKDCQVYGGASRLLKAFDWVGSIVSYCNESKFSGKVYESLGFTKKHVTRSYHYEKDGKAYNRATFMKHKLVKKYPEWANLSERQITERLGYMRVEENQATWVLRDNIKYYIYQIQIGPYSYIGQHGYYKLDDSYMGSGSILKRVQSKYKTLGNKTILIDNLTKEQANKFEMCAIRIDKMFSNNINIQKGGQGYRVHGGAAGNNGANKGIKFYYNPTTGEERGFRDEEEIPVGFIKGSVKRKHTYTEEQRKQMSVSRKGRKAWNKGKKMENINVAGIKLGTVNRKNKVDSMIPTGWIRLKEAADRLGCARQTVLKKYPSQVIMEGKQKITIVKWM